MRRDVAAVRERVDPGLLGREAEQRPQVVDVRVDAAVGDEPEQVDAVAALERRAEERRVLEERAVLDRLVHAHQVLVEDPAGADRQVADLGVAHLAGRQADRLAGGVERRVRVLGPEPVEDGRVGELDGVARAGRRAAPAVEDDERYETGFSLRPALANRGERVDVERGAADERAVDVRLGEELGAFSGLTEPP